MTRAILFLAALLIVTPAQAAEWRLVAPESRIGFVATYEDVAFDAWFRSFEAAIRFAPDALDQAVFDIRIDVSSVDSASPDRDAGMKQPEWLAAESHPEARFHAERFERRADGRFTALGRLDLKGTTRAIEVPFTWERSGGKAVITAETGVRRGQFGIGTGEWADDDTIGFEVTIRARLALERR